MREAGFSSTAVKNNIEEYSNNIITTTTATTQTTTTPLFFFTGSGSSSGSENASKFVFEIFLGMRKRKNVVLVGDSSEGVVLEVMRKFKMGEVPEEMKGVKFVEFVPYNNNSSSNVSEFLRRKLGENYDHSENNGGGVVVYVGDLKWIVERGICSNYGVDGLVGEIESLLLEGFHYNDHNNNNIKKKIKIWVMGVASYQIYMRCQMRLPSLETQWDLHALPLPSSGLALNLQSSRYQIFSLFLTPSRR